MVRNWVMAMPLRNEIVAETVTKLSRRGSTSRRQRKNHSPNRPRDRVAGHNRLFLDYFAENPIYTDDQFRQRFRMRRSLFLHIVDRVQQRDPWFQQKCTTAMRLLAYGVATDQIDEYVRIS
ncbi:uncharacterized protein LOC110710243 [Chenopodium quinoa]|uniref:uncharacterized protein LOC110710243 n=1 Tax=Chenopodium quinoa TaxID=63459 RepID=UPI000B782D00|nr:uncharacterized protein LOC110710243 [Chenopodium quinoa]